MVLLGIKRRDKMEDKIKKILLRSLEKGEVNEEWAEQKSELFRAVSDLFYLENKDIAMIGSDCNLDIIHFDVFAVICHTKNVIVYHDNDLDRLILIKTNEKYFDNYFAFLQTLLPYELDKLEKILLKKFFNWSFDNAFSSMVMSKREARIFLYDTFAGKEQVLQLVSLLKKNIDIASPTKNLGTIFARTLKEMLVGR